MHKVYRYVVHGINGCELVDRGWKLVRFGRSGLKMNESGLKMNGTGGVRMGVGGSGWEGVGARFSTTNS